MTTVKVNASKTYEILIGTDLLDKCGELTAQSDTGDMILKNVVAEAAFDIETSTGDVKLEKCDAAKMTVKTSTGSVKGSLLTDKMFDVKTSTGKITVPESQGENKCRITTSTGDVNITIE